MLAGKFRLLLFLVAAPSWSEEAQPIFYSTLDNADAVNQPAIGTGSGASIVTSPQDDFVPAHDGQGIRLESPTEYVRFKQTDGATQNVELDQGTVDFWFKPFYDHDDGIKYRIFSNGDWGRPGTLAFGKHAAVNGNGFYLHYFPREGVPDVVNFITADKYGWNAGEWINIRVTWNWKAAEGERNVRVYFDSAEADVEGDDGLSPPTTGPQPLGAESASQYFYVGNTDTQNTSMSNDAIFDELRIWDVVLPPNRAPAIVSAPEAMPNPVSLLP